MHAKERESGDVRRGQRAAGGERWWWLGDKVNSLAKHPASTAPTLFFFSHRQLVESLFRLPPFISPLLGLLTEGFPLHNASHPTEEDTITAAHRGV